MDNGANMNAILIDRELKAYLNAYKKLNLTVHSVFKEAINLVDEKGELITLLTANRDIGPMGVLVSQNSRNFTKIVPGERVEKRISTLFFKSSKVTLNYTNAKEWDRCLGNCQCNLSEEVLVPKRSQVRKVLLDRGEATGLLPLICALERYKGVKDKCVAIENNTYSEFIQDVFLELVKLLDQDDFEGVVSILPKFIGFGPGLTPSTDDFLSGVLLTKRAECIFDNRPVDALDMLALKVYENACGRTTKVSESMLKHVAQGRATENQIQLIEAIFSPESNSIEGCTRRVLMNGATSGSDFVLGVYCSLLLHKVKEPLL